MGYEVEGQKYLYAIECRGIDNDYVYTFDKKEVDKLAEAVKNKEEWAWPYLSPEYCDKIIVPSWSDYEDQGIGSDEILDVDTLREIYNELQEEAAELGL